VKGQAVGSSIDNPRGGKDRLISADLSVESIQKQLERILASRGFVHSERPSRLLRFVVDQTLHGLGHQLKEYVLGVEVLGRGTSFDPKIDPIVRVEAGRLRTRLKDYYESEGRDDPVFIDFPKGAYVPTFQERKILGPRIEHEVASPRGIEVSRQTVRDRPSYRSRYLLISGGIVLAVALGVIWQLTRSSVRLRGPVFTRLTSDIGLTTDPALSPDGKLLAYASDRSGDGNLDIYMQQTARGQPMRLTHDSADERQPSFSPDGTKIVFRSEREEGGIYVMSTLGGEQRLIANGGLNPRFSPDGYWIVYWHSGQRSGDPTYGGKDKIYIVPFSGGQPRQLRPDFDAARFPIWTPDGKYLLFEGTPSLPLLGHLAKEEDWWVTPLNGGKAIKTGAFDRFSTLGLSDFVFPSTWAAAGNRVVFSAGFGDSANLWQVGISPRTWQVTSTPERLTSGAGLEDQPCAAADGRLVFSSLTYNMNIWSLPLDASQGKVTGELKRVTQNAALDKAFDLSADGRKVVFLSTRFGNWDVWCKDLDSGKENQLTFTPTKEEGWPQMTADGSKISYHVSEKEKAVMYVISAGGGMAEKLCEECCEQGPWNWSSDGRWFLYPSGRERSASRPSASLMVGLLNLATEKETALLRHEQYDLFQGYFSPDDRWITFSARLGPDRTRLFVVPFAGERELKESEWIAVTDGSHKDFKSRWSPDGNLLYFVSQRDGFRCLWAQRLDPTTKRPLGPSFEVFPSHQARLSLMNVDVTALEFSVARDKIVFNLGELGGNIWMANFDEQQ
jgi:eukaryotic-like serine/threonine-protein kinase